jgi:hypothetical protein
MKEIGAYHTSEHERGVLVKGGAEYLELLHEAAARARFLFLLGLIFSSLATLIERCFVTVEGAADMDERRLEGNTTAVFCFPNGDASKLSLLRLYSDVVYFISYLK